MITSHDVARLAGVSQPTVSRALSDHPKVSEATKQKVREAALALGYAPNAIGRALSTGPLHRASDWSSPTWTTSSTPTSSPRCTTSSGAAATSWC